MILNIFVRGVGGADVDSFKKSTQAISLRKLNVFCMEFKLVHEALCWPSMCLQLRTHGPDGPGGWTKEISSWVQETEKQRISGDF